MCPLRFVLIFLSAACAAFLFFKGVSASASVSQPHADSSTHNAGPVSSTRFSKISGALSSWFWTCVDMASGRYLWRTFSAMNKPAAATD